MFDCQCIDIIHYNSVVLSDTIVFGGPCGSPNNSEILSWKAVAMSAHAQMAMLCFSNPKSCVSFSALSWFSLEADGQQRLLKLLSLGKQRRLESEIIMLICCRQTLSGWLYRSCYMRLLKIRCVCVCVYIYICIFIWIYIYIVFFVYLNVYIYTEGRSCSSLKTKTLLR